MNFEETEKLIIDIKNNKSDSSEILRLFEPLIMNIANRYSLIGYDFEDIKQECYLTLVSAINNYDVSRRAFVAFATSSVKNHIYNLLRAQLRSKKDMELLILEDKLKFYLPDPYDLESNFLKNEESILLQKALFTLTIKEINLLDYIYYKNKTLSQYSRSHNIPYSLARSQKLCILKKLRKYLTFDEENI